MWYLAAETSLMVSLNMSWSTISLELLRTLALSKAYLIAFVKYSEEVVGHCNYRYKDGRCSARVQMKTFIKDEFFLLYNIFIMICNLVYNSNQETNEFYWFGSFICFREVFHYCIVWFLEWYKFTTCIFKTVCSCLSFK